MTMTMKDHSRINGETLLKIKIYTRNTQEGKKTYPNYSNETTKTADRIKETRKKDHSIGHLPYTKKSNEDIK